MARLTFNFSFKPIITVMLALVIAIAAPTALSAASMEISASLKTAWDKMIEKADSTTKVKLNVLYNDFTTLQQQEQSIDEQIKTNHYANEQAELALRKQIKLIDAAKIQQLEKDVTAIRERYKPLFASYAALNQQITAARLLKDKDLNALLRSQADLMKIAVQLARQEIKTKEAALKAAKAQVAQKTKVIRAALAEADPLQIEIRAQKSAISATKKRASASWTSFTQAVRKAEASTTLGSFSSVVSDYRMINTQKQNVLTLEKRVNDKIVKAKKLL
ncbi:hypothetical protein Back11_42570 [Paenibacillus baekrokdamisoli]|uniref:Uncharacterized protein n=1 Tax=Paenibacillus baekrokdamisoli TaxID=1712516 RepID=A0A3G9IX69_9BACL|nr:hypothetical protein [Paenibacillus baekrokdamisoli]MBB3068042.1 Arc/MetJ-type ribon-helix-helix transcriptional regulator [Paenibacillus baekrokdamisoli]BBH22912.1 hypothetical protein Back11_42570 [Paenibacillus baekrokdamisoli]